ncbi:hypothetical protein ENUP19_0311G0030 [Entamoeba nuttalli]|uniref:Cullin family protein n=2 Tax=Entamoeba nuttalli TaxID=412467 RepID=K2HN74_ENTNP|nr:cullin family protein [Entamoeba nuttalli P19]EKE37290.1 cullin family protein [Entamoeba nuttalli P19]|eukprot:XP_008860375.1 cullin family protein [Entamoeba nuttalli P19]
MTNQPQEKKEVDKLFSSLNPFFDIIFKGKGISLGELNKYYCSVYSCFEDVSYAGDYGLEKLEEVLNEYLVNKTKILSQTEKRKIPKQLQNIFEQWKNIRKNILFVFGTLDFCPHQKVNGTVKSVLKHSFKHVFFKYLIKQIDLFNILINIISESRFNKGLTIEEYESILSILQFHFDEQLSFYLQSFQKQFEEQTMTDYNKFINKIKTLPIHECLILLERFIENENDLIKTALLPNMQQPIKEMLNKEVLLKLTTKALTVFPELLIKKEKEDIQIISLLWNKTKENNEFLNPIDEYFRLKFHKELEEESKKEGFNKNIKQIVYFLFKFKNLTEELKKEYFKGNIIFGECVTNSFKSCLVKNKITNEGDEKQTEVLLATFIHNIMTNIKSEEDTMKELTNVLDIVSYLTDKESFIILHQKFLLKRIIQNTIKSILLESSVVDDISKNFSCSASFKLKQIIKDYTLSLEMTKEFCNKNQIPLKLNIIVFSKFLFNANDIYCSIQMDSYLQNIWNLFVTSYKSIHTDRKLELNQLCCSVILSYYNGIKESKLEISYIQYCILMKLHDNGKLTINELQKSIAPSLDSFKFHLNSLINYNILSSSNGFEGNSLIWFTNNSITDGFLLNKIDKKLVNNQNKNKGKTKESESKKFTAVICYQVKLMKQRKDLSYNDLIKCTLSQLSSSFNIDIKLAKQGVEYLIEKEYILRDEQDNGLFHYIA